MKSYYDLLKNNIIDFDKLIIDKYHLLGLNEVETIILIKLNKQLRLGKKSLSLSQIVPFMSISEEECSKIIINLVEKGFISLELSSVEAKEAFNLDETYKKLEQILITEDSYKEDDDTNNAYKETIVLLEKELKKILNPIEKEIVSKWFFEYHYTNEEIDEAILKALKYPNRGIQFIDRFLFKKHADLEENEFAEKSEIQDLFNQIYDRKK